MFQQNFARALEWLRDDHRVYRGAWNDKRWLELRGGKSKGSAEVIVVCRKGCEPEPYVPLQADLLASDWGFHMHSQT